jgi:hypothetical protein
VALAIHDERLTRRVGAVVLALAAATIVFVVMLLPELERGGVDVRIHFGRVTGLSEGAPVRVAGRSIGHVRNIGIARGGGVFVEIRLDPSWAARVPINSDWLVDARSPLAPRYIAIGPPPGHADPARAVADGDEVTGLDPPDLDTVLQRTWDNLTEVEQFLDAIRPASRRIDAAAARLSITVRALAPGDALDARLASAIDEARAVIADLRDAGLDPDGLARLAARVDACASHVNAAVSDLRTRIAEIRLALAAATSRDVDPSLRARLDHALASADRALASAQDLTTGLVALTRDATSGDGSVAAFASDLELTDDVKDLTRQLKNEFWRELAPPPE